MALTPFPAAIAVAYFAKETHYAILWNRWMLVATLLFLTAFACFLAGVTGRALPLIKPRFPNIKVDIYGAGSVTAQSPILFSRGIGTTAGSMTILSAQLQLFFVRFLNIETEQNASLTVRLYVKLIPGSFGPVGEAVCTPPGWELPADLKLKAISTHMVLPPGHSVDGNLVYEISQIYEGKVAPLGARLEIEDHISGKRMSIPAEMGNYDKRNMVPSSGGVEILETEYEPEPARPGDDESTPPKPSSRPS